MKRATVHYRTRRPDGRIDAFGCGHAGASGSLQTAFPSEVTCNGCKRTPKWKEANASPKRSTEHG